MLEHFIKSKIIRIILDFIIVSILLTINIHVLSMDIEQLVYITSDTQLIDIQNNIITFTGKVKVTQGTLKINADKIVVINFYGKQDIIDGYGSPVTFYQIQDDGKLILGKALQIHYEPINNYIILIGNACLNRLGSSIISDKISYLIKKQKVQAFSKKNQQVIMTLVPSQLQNKK